MGRGRAASADALEIDGRTVQRADERPRRPGRGLGITGDREGGIAGGDRGKEVTE